MLKVEQLKVHGLPPLSFEVAGGRCLAVQGPSGSGKSLLLRAIADLDPADGEVVLDGQARSSMSAIAWRRQIRYLAAEPGWWEQTPRPHFADAEAPAVRAAMASLGLERDKMDQELTSLSTGERQRLALIRGMEDDPAVLLFDEPTSALDTASAGKVEALIKTVLERGRHVLLVSHDGDLLDRLSDERIVLPGRSGNGAHGAGGAGGADEQLADSASPEAGQ